jgi:hypothetical protein
MHSETVADATNVVFVGNSASANLKTHMMLANTENIVNVRTAPVTFP